ncbi:hypothetical protein M8494_16300 [Serratia ureilytica]
MNWWGALTPGACTAECSRSSLSCGAAGALRQTAGRGYSAAIARMAKWHGAQRVALATFNGVGR